VRQDELLPRGANGVELLLEMVRAAEAAGELVESRRVEASLPEKTTNG